MQRDEIQHLAHLARISITDELADTLQKDLDDILSYVQAIQELSDVAGDSAELNPDTVNQVREDTQPHAPGAYSADLIAAFPDQADGYLKINQVISHDHDDA